MLERRGHDQSPDAVAEPDEHAERQLPGVPGRGRDLPGRGGPRVSAGSRRRGLSPVPDAAACPECPACPDAGPTGPQVIDFPYEQFIPANYQLDPAAIREAAYHLYYAGGCCHGSYRGLLEHLATTIGAPFKLLPLDFGMFGGGGIAGYGSMCGSLLGSILIINSIVADGTARTALITDLLRWYEKNAFPAYLPTATDAGEHVTKDFSSTGIVNLQVVPNSHLCHVSVSTWCAFNGASAGSGDKKARCSRLTADVAGKAAEMLNAYLKDKAYTATLAPDSATAGCLSCHTAANAAPPSVASGMSCGSCHADKVTGPHP